MIKNFHSFFPLSYNPWPVIASLGVFNFGLAMVIFFKSFDRFPLIIAILLLVLSSMNWWNSYRNEYNTEGYTSFKMEEGLKFSFILFISSEILFFFSFFWGFFHFLLNPQMELGHIWPPVDLMNFDYIIVPLLNTLLLLSSATALTMAHNDLIQGLKPGCVKKIVYTILLGLIFRFFQGIEYRSSFFSLRDGTYGSSFFILTGFHGLHVIIGFSFLLVVAWRISKLYVGSKCESSSFEISRWYWHFVDVVWIFLYFFLYYLN